MWASRVCVGMLLTAVAASALWSCGAEPVPPADISPPDGLANGAPAVAEHGAVGPDAHGDGEATSTPSPPMTERTIVAARGIEGIALDHEGLPLAGIRIRLLRIGVPERERSIATTDAEGKFAFDGARGAFTIGIWNALTFARDITVEPGERRFVELRADEPCFLLSGCLRRGGEVVVGREVLVQGQDRLGKVRHQDVTDDDGVFRHLLRPGDYEILVAKPEQNLGQRKVGPETLLHGPPRSLLTLALTGHRSREVHDLVLPANRLQVECRNAFDGSPVTGAHATVHGISPIDERRARRTDHAGTATVEELEHGRYRVSVAAPWFVARTFELSVGSVADRVHCDLLPAGRLRVFLPGTERAEHTGIRLQLADGTMLPTADLQVGDADWAFEFSAIPPGRHLLTTEDRLDAQGRRVYLPFVPLPPLWVDVSVGVTTDVRPSRTDRPILLVRAVGPGGERVTAPITVTGAAGEVASVLGVQEGTWRSSVEPGQYTVSAAGPNGLRTETVEVRTDLVRHDITLP